MEQMNRLGKKREPFLFVLSYDLKEKFIQPLKELDSDVLFKIGEQRNYPQEPLKKAYYLHKNPIEFKKYNLALEKVLEQIRSGNSYLLNLTFKTQIESNLTLKEIFTYAKAKY